jgi:[acyl-carrier-protein] S-malonyltransferase
MVGYLFAGQGSQYVGMGKDLYESFPESRRIFDAADAALGFPLSRLCFEGPETDLRKTDNCQPAIVTVSIAAWEAFKVTKSPGHKVTGTRSCAAPGQVGMAGTRSCAAGLSLGEYSALVAAGAIDFQDAVRLVRRRGEFMEEAAGRRPGGMLSIIGLDVIAVRDICSRTGIEIANLNCPGQTVVSGSVDGIRQAQALAKEKGAKLAVILEVSGAFHSSFMKEAGDRLSAELEKVRFHAAAMPVVANVTAAVATDAALIKENLRKQVSGSVRWEDSMRFMLEQGIKKYYEFGPGKVLKGLMRRIDSAVEVVSIEKKEDILN